MDDGLKQRLVGAVVLAAVAVIFLPSLFDKENRRRVDTRTQVPVSPGVDAVKFQEPVRPKDIQAAKPPEQMYQMVEPEALADSKTVEPQLDKQGVPLAWVVQVASFKSPDRAASFRDKLIGEGYKAFVRTVKSSKGSATRVFVGPKLDKQRAQSIKAELDRAHKVNALVLKFKP